MKDQESFDKLPSVPGVLTFREDYDKLYVNKKNGWDPVVTREEVRIYRIFNCDLRVPLNGICSHDAKRTQKFNDVIG